MLTPTAQELAQGETAVTNAKLSLQNALDALAGLLTLPAQELAQAETAVTNAKLSVENTREALNALKAGPTTGDLAKAQAQVDSATASLANAQGDLSLVNKEWDGKLAKAQEVVDASTESYLLAFPEMAGHRRRTDRRAPGPGHAAGCLGDRPGLPLQPQIEPPGHQDWFYNGGPASRGYRHPMERVCCICLDEPLRSRRTYL